MPMASRYEDHAKQLLASLIRNTVQNKIRFTGILKCKWLQFLDISMGIDCGGPESAGFEYKLKKGQITT